MKPMLRVPSTRLLSAAAALAVLATAACGTTSAPGSGATGAGSTPVGSSTPSEPDASGTTGATGSSAEATGTAGGVRLVASVAPGSPSKGIAATPGLVIGYTLTNTTSAPVTAYDVVPASLGSATLAADTDPEHAWVYAQGGTVRVSKQGFDTAPNVRFAAAPVIGARPVPAGGSLGGTAFVPTPLAVAVPGADFTAPRGPLPAGADSFTFCVQVGAAAKGMRPSVAVKGVLEAPVAAPQADGLVCTSPLKVPVS